MSNSSDAVNVSRIKGVVTGYNGIVISSAYSSFDSSGVTVIVVTACISLVCSVLLLGLLGISLWKKRSSPSGHIFVRTHAAAFFSCLLVGDVIQSIGSIMSSRWLREGGVTLNPYCSTQGAIKNAGNLSVSLWTLTLSIHTFLVLFLRWTPKDRGLYISLLGVWFLVGFIVLLGPAAIQKNADGPYFGISGFWCWISDPYVVSRVVWEYMWLLGSAGLSFLLYTLTFLRLRGNISIHEGRLKFRRIKSENAWKHQVIRDSADIQMTAVSKGMIGFPILFTVTVLPIAICRFVAWSGKPVPVQATIFADAVFSLKGVFDLILFSTTRSLLPAKGMLPWWFYPRPKVSEEVMEHGVQPYHIQDFASAHGFNEMYQSQAERSMVSVPRRTSASLSRLEAHTRALDLNNTPDVSSIPIPPIPVEKDDHYTGLDRTLTTKTVASNYSQDDDDVDVVDYQEPTSTTRWDFVDLGRKVSPVDGSNPFEDSASPRPQARESYTIFDLSAYGVDNDAPEVPPIPASPNDYRVARRKDDDDDDNDGADPHRASFNTAVDVDLSSPGIQPSGPSAKRF